MPYLIFVYLYSAQCVTVGNLFYKNYKWFQSELKLNNLFTFSSNIKNMQNCLGYILLYIYAYIQNIVY